jgi:hypothetical protein
MPTSRSIAAYPTVAGAKPLAAAEAPAYRPGLSSLVSVNLGAARPTEHSDIGYAGIDKRPARGPVQVRAPGPKGVGGSGLAGDRVCDLSHHGGVGTDGE